VHGIRSGTFHSTTRTATKRNCVACDPSSDVIQTAEVQSHHQVTTRFLWHLS
jgi:hypothetical protein